MKIEKGMFTDRNILVDFIREVIYLALVANIYTVAIDRILSVKNARAWVSIDFT